jgi:hypothetical protein
MSDGGIMLRFLISICRVILLAGRLTAATYYVDAETGADASSRPTHPGRCDEWHLDYQNSVPHIAFGIPPGFSEKAIVLGSAFSQPRFISVGPIGDTVFGDRIE